MLLGRVLKALLALTLVAAPVVRDACLFMCHTPKHASAAGSPSCHHAVTAAGVHLRAPGGPCEHGGGPHDAAIAARPSLRDVIRDLGFGIRDSVGFVAGASWLGLPDPANLSSLANPANPKSRIPNPLREVPLRI